ncbi:MAG TPA: HAD-IC family P-type ATPase, partial [Myxococcales bacterium]|nr:HAD-IC family P-type ATPase [Myxococcales bacterium]
MPRPEQPTRDAALPAYRLPAAEVAAALGSDPQRGLSSEEAARRLAAGGKNELPRLPPLPAWRRFLSGFRDPLTLLLLAATAVSLMAWWIERESAVPYEALTIVAIVILNGVLGFVQESRAEQAIAALEAMSAPGARVLRDGAQRSVPADLLVAGDVLLLEEGDIVPADARVLESIALRAAESALTGESSAASKDEAPLSSEAGIADRSNMVFSGTAIASGRGRALVTATGAASEIGRIARSLGAAREGRTPLQRELDRIGKALGIAVVAIAVAIGATILALAHVRSLTDLVDVLLLAVSLAVAAVPEGLTAVTTIVLSVGTQRMARRNVIVRRLSSVETLGSTTTICSDKTGTLTRNEMTVRRVVTASGAVDLTGTGYEPSGSVEQDGEGLRDAALRDEIEKTLAAADLANNAALLEKDGRWIVQGDPTEGALVVAARKLGAGPRALRRRFSRVGEVPFSSERKLMSTAHTDAEDEGRLMVFVKGAPDVLLLRCTGERLGSGTRSMTPARREQILRAIDELGARALRTIGVAYRVLPRDAVGRELGGEVEQALVFLGVVGMIDPPRPEAQESVAQARRAGVRPVMITGDHPVTAAAIAVELGIAERGARPISGAALEKMGDEELRDAVRATSVYARVAPEHKLRIVRALQA